MRNKTLASVEHVGTKKMLHEEQNFSIRGTSRNKKGYMRNKILASAKQVGKKGYMRNKTLASVEQVGTKNRLHEEQNFSIRGTSRNKKGYMRNKHKINI
jgi:hypothetical protein